MRINKDDYIELLNTEIGGVKIKDIDAMPFLQWMSKKLNGVKKYSSATNELTALLITPPMSKKMPDEEKIRVIKKLLELGVEIN